MNQKKNPETPRPKEFRGGDYVGYGQDETPPASLEDHINGQTLDINVVKNRTGTERNPNKPQQSSKTGNK